MREVMKASDLEAVPNLSLWSATTALPSHPPLLCDEQADVCVIGAGIAGLTTAYLLAVEGYSVVVLEGHRMGDGETRSTTAHLSSVIDDRFVEIERIHGQAGALQAARSHAAAIDQIEAIVHAEQIDCGFERLDGYLFPAPGDGALIESELRAARRAGLHVELLPSAPLGGPSAGPCLRFHDQAQFHPLAYLGALARALGRLGGRIFGETHAERVHGGAPGRVHAGPWVVTADAVVVATNVPVNDLVTIHTKQAPYTTYVIGASIPRGSVEKALYWDTADPYHYARIASAPGDAPDVLIVGGEDHRTGEIDGEPSDRHRRLEQWAREHFPSMLDVDYTWAGQVMETLDGLAYIGRNPGDEANVFVITGDSGMGMTHGTLGGMLVRDLVTGRENPWQTLYEPSRKPILTLGKYVREALGMASRYGDWLTPGDVSSPSSIAPGSGAILRRGLTKVAVYRDEEGAFHECSAVCPHLGGIVAWNGATSTWDCPAHGSRFDARGRVVHGPANSDLARTTDQGAHAHGKGVGK